MQSFCPETVEKHAQFPFVPLLLSSAENWKNGQNPVWGRNGQKDEMRVLSLMDGFAGNHLFFCVIFLQNSNLKNEGSFFSSSVEKSEGCVVVLLPLLRPSQV
jgi:hypothetical protein